MKTRRLAVFAILVLGLYAIPFAVAAQEARVYRVGVVLQGGAYAPAIDGLRDGLRALGLEDGKHVLLDVRDAKGNLKSAETAARRLEAKKVDVIYSVATSVTLAVKRVTTSVPIVFYVSTDPVTFGLVESFRKPGG